MKTALEILSESLAEDLEIVDRHQEKAIVHAMKEYAKQWVDKFAEDAVVFLPSHPHLHGTKNIDTGLVRHLKQYIDAQ